MQHTHTQEAALPSLSQNLFALQHTVSSPSATTTSRQNTWGKAVAEQLKQRNL